MVPDTGRKQIGKPVLSEPVPAYSLTELKTSCGQKSSQRSHFVTNSENIPGDNTKPLDYSPLEHTREDFFSLFVRYPGQKNW